MGIFLAQSLYRISERLGELPKVFIETGTWKGQSIRNVQTTGIFQELHTIELSETLYKAAQEPLTGLGVQCHLGDSKRLLKRLGSSYDQPVCFYLDAHFCKEKSGEGAIGFPLWSEMDYVRGRGLADVVIIDDTHTFGKRRPDLKGKLEGGSWESVTKARILDFFEGRVVDSFEIQDMFVVKLKPGPKLVEILVPCYKRIEYTERYVPLLIERTDHPGRRIVLVDDGSCDQTGERLEAIAQSHEGVVARVYPENKGLRFRVLEFWLQSPASILAKMDNDCIVPEGWLTKLVEILDECPELGIVSPLINVASVRGQELYGETIVIGRDVGKRYWEAERMGGLWCMKRQVIDSFPLEKKSTEATPYVKGAWELMCEVKAASGMQTGWLPEVVVEHVGCETERHPERVNTPEHDQYVKGRIATNR